MSVDIKGTYGAVGDGQIATLTVSFSSVTNPTHLIVFSNTFSNAVDAGKKIAVQDWVLATGANPAGALLGTIVSVGSFAGGQQTLVLDITALQSVTSAAKAVEWGTDDTAAFSAYNVQQAGNSNVVLTIPSGRYCGAIAGGASFPIGKGLKSSTYNGTGNPVLTDMLAAGSGFALNFNGSPLFNDNRAESLIQTVSAGATVLRMVTVADAAKYTANTWAWMTGFDLQGDGEPPNPYWGEFVQITAVDTVGGSVTIAAPGLKNSYKSTWPKWKFGVAGDGAPTYANGKFSRGGPATLYLLDQSFDAEQTWNGVSFRSTQTVMNAGARSITINNATFEAFGPNVSFQKTFTADNITVPVQWELDKGTETFVLTNSTVRGFLIASSSPFDVTLDNVIVQNQMPGTTKRWTARNCTFPAGASFGPASFGVGEHVNISDSSFAGQTIVGGVQEGDITGAGGYTKSGTIIGRLKFGGTSGPPQWAIPGQYFMYGSHYSYEDPAVLCKDMWDDGTTLFILTDDPNPFPALVSPATTLSIITAPPPNFTFTNCTGCDDAVSWSAVTPNKPVYSQWKLTYNGNIGAANAAHQVKAVGQGVRVKITVGAGYSAGTFNLSSPFVLNKPANTTVFWTPVVDLTQPGVRDITPAGGVVALGADTGLDWPNGGNIWFIVDQITAAMSGAVGAGSVTLEITTDQGFKTATVVPLRFRLHA